MYLAREQRSGKRSQISKLAALFSHAPTSRTRARLRIPPFATTEMALKPDNISLQEATSAHVAGPNAWQALISKAKLNSGDKVLIHAGPGSFDTPATPVAIYFGAQVAATCCPRNANLVRDLGTRISEWTINPVIDGGYPMAEAAKAPQAHKDGRAVSKVVIAVL